MQNLNQKLPIVNDDLTPNDYFMRLLQDRGLGQDAISKLVDALDLREITVSPTPGLAVTNGKFTDTGPIQIAADISGLLDTLGAARGDIIFRGAAGWVVLAAGALGDFLESQGPGADPQWSSTTANIQTLLDGISSVRGVMLYRGVSGWVALAPGTVGQVLGTGGAGADPLWVAGGGIPDAPSDGTTYGRNTGAWVAVTGGGGAWRPLVDGSVPPNLMYEPDGSLIMEEFTP